MMETLLETDRLTLVGGPEVDVRSEFAADVRAGLCASPKSLSCRYLYDAEGSRLFDEICRLPEYYPTRTEASILRALAPELVERMGVEPQLVELGSGSAEKTRVLIDAFLHRHGQLNFVPIDISVNALSESSRSLLANYDGLRVHAMAGEYGPALAHLPPAGDAPRLVLWLGSSIGNFDREDAKSFLRSLHASLRPGDAMLVGIDLRKDCDVLGRAYDDSAGVTARFNKNLLVRINRELDADFELEAFEHRAVCDSEAGRVQMNLVAQKAMTVRVGALDLELTLAEGEAIHTENSHKYDTNEIDELIRSSGFELERRWVDAAALFSVNLLSRP